MTKEIDHNDYWYIKDNPLSKIGVFPYLGRQISEELEPDKIYQVLRSEEELNNEETLNSFKLVPIVDDHTMLGTKPGMKPAEEKGVHGVIGDDVYYKDGIIYGDLKIFSETLKEEIENGKKELSMGYFCEYELTDGEYNGEPYQAIQRNLRINHVALVDEGRMGADVRVMDKKITFDSINEIKEIKKMEEEKKQVDACGKDEDVDKRKLIDEIGGILKPHLDEELWRTVIGKIEEIGYNDSEAGAGDEDIKEDDKPAAEVTVSNGEAEVTVSLDSMIKEIAKRDSLVEAVKPIIGDNKNFKSMTVEAVAKYACDKLDLKAAKGQELATIKGFVAAHNKLSKQTYSLDAKPVSNGKDAAFEAYLK